MPPRSSTTTDTSHVSCHVYPHYGAALEEYRYYWSMSKQDLLIQAIEYFLQWHDSPARGESWWPLAAPSDGYAISAQIDVALKAQVVALSERYSVTYSAILSNALMRWAIDEGLEIPDPDKTPAYTVKLILAEPVRAWIARMCDGPDARFPTRTALLGASVDRWLTARVRLHNSSLGYPYKASPKDNIEGHTATYIRTELGYDVVVGAWADQDFVDKKTVYYNALLGLFEDSHNA